ncbi:MAG: hypothetical protein ACFFBC_00085 [Promethearchaeota archaeon]
MRKKHFLILITLLLTTLIGLIGIAPQQVHADDPISYVPTSYQGKKGSYSGGSLDNLWEKDSLYFEWDVESTYIPPFFTIYEFKVVFFFDENVGPVNEIRIELSFHQQVSIQVHYEDGSAEGGTTWQGSWSVSPNGKEVVKIIASCIYFYPANPTCRFNLIRLYPIAIASPADGASYSEPMEGYYPGTYGFEDEIDGTSGTAIDFIDSASAYSWCKIQGSYTDTNNVIHNKVLHVEDMYRNYYTKVSHTFDSPQYLATIDFWFLMTNKYTGPVDKILFYATDDQNNIIFRLNMGDGKIIDSGENEAPMSYNKWYHIRIYFVSILPEGYYDWYLNDELQYSDVPCETSYVYTSKLVIASYDDYLTKGEAYFDAFGFDWEPGYTIGLNRKEGIFVDIKHTNIDNLNYSIDDGESIDIRGDFVIPFPFTRDHTIKVGGTSDGIPVESPPTTFSFDYGEKYAVLIWNGHMSGEWRTEYYSILWAEGFHYIFQDENPRKEDVAYLLSDVADIANENDIIFIYLFGWGYHTGGISSIIFFGLHPDHWITSTQLKYYIDQIPSSRKMVLVGSSFSGQFIEAFDEDGYIIMTCTDTESHGHIFDEYIPPTDFYHEEIFVDAFFDEITNGATSYEAFAIAQPYIKDMYENEPYDERQNPQMSDRCDIDFFGY